MAKVAFKKGLLANLPAAISEGTFYITTDERAMYLDIDGTTRVRIGDFQEFATLTALQANTNPSTTALYYVTELNCLAKWDGTKYVQINLDTGATSVETTGTGNALDGVTYDPATRKLTFTKTTTFTTASDVDSQIAAKVGELKIGEETFATVKAYVDKKTDGIATDAALAILTGRVTTAEGKIDKLNGDATTDGSVAKTVVDAIDALNLANTYEAKGAKDADIKAAKDAADAAQADVDTLVGADTGKSARTIANEELAKQLIPENANEALDTLAEIAAWIQAHPDDASAMNAAITKLQAILAGIGGDDEKATVVTYVTDAIAALSIGDYAKAADLTALAARVTALETDSHTHANKAELDKIADGDKVKWDAAEAKAHEHANATVLNGVTAEKVATWDAAEQNAKDYADSLAGDYDVAGAASTALDSAKNYTDIALEWGTF